MLVNLDNSRSLANLKETIGIWGATAVSAIASHVHNTGAYEGVQVTNLIQKGLKFVTILRSTAYVPSGSIHLSV